MVIMYSTVVAAEIINQGAPSTPAHYKSKTTNMFRGRTQCHGIPTPVWQVQSCTLVTDFETLIFAPKLDPDAMGELEEQRKSLQPILHFSSSITKSQFQPSFTQQGTVCYVTLTLV
jgi:hypothetical protein